MLKTIWKTLQTAFKSPSAFEGAPWKFAINQAGHMAVVGLIGGFILPWWLALAAYAAWEAAQWWWSEADAWDGVQDVAFVAAGILAAVTMTWPPLAVAGLFLLAGTLRRAATPLKEMQDG
ncbi:hypothetical protein DDZ14_16065 [Maritimibacter sp. 55A14]|uniref:hypothetical protein n=1 Tax=Maritimibacter sp. 55A14 TaxID=2174844 RepID=UPI000D613F9C|nr:hypothetical protein [Maritimibacter sp. 55A14]PWE29956.1 hypothetical protein DDZ14_16065 [Maritimibacter sp. 55A14]